MGESQPKAKKIRLDQLVLERGLAPTRTRAQAFILAGEICSGDHCLSKPGHLVAADLPLTLRLRHGRYVSRGGDKLEGALADFKLQAAGAACLDIGASTGGFTDCLLQQGAARVTCLDVGKGQLHQRLRTDPRVEFHEGINVRYLRPEDYPGPFDLIVVDVAFISLTKILPVIAPRLRERSGRLLALIKPQFEVGPAAIGKGGIVREAKEQEGAIKKVAAQLAPNGLAKVGIRRSHLTGTDGNVEFFLLAKRKP